MKKRIVVAALMPLFMMLLTGCHLKHDWQEATCTTPRTCLTGEEMEGEALGHTWVDANCTEPKHCSVCGETEGKPLGHKIQGEPTYQSPAFCSVCGEAAVEPLEADFDALGLAWDMEVGESYDYTTTCRKSHDLKTVATMTITNYDILEADNTHDAKEGYEWRIVSFDLTFSDQNARDYGYLYGYQMADYYDSRLMFDSIEEVDEEDDASRYLVNYNGEECEAYMSVRHSSVGWIDHVVTVSVTYDFQVPAGYDGIVIHAYDEELEPDPESEEKLFAGIYDTDGANTHLFFRLN